MTSAVFLSPAKIQLSTAEWKSSPGNHLLSAENSPEISGVPLMFRPGTPQFLSQATAISRILAGKPLEYFVKKESGNKVKAEERLNQWRELAGFLEGYSSEVAIPAAWMYRGLAFTSLNFPEIANRVVSGTDYQADLYILSGLYGVLRPTDAVYPYRLDFSYSGVSPGPEAGLKSYWARVIGEAFEATRKTYDVIFDCSSGEFSPVIPSGAGPVIRIDVREMRGGEWKSISANAKKFRGAAAAQLLLAPPVNPAAIQEGIFAGHRFHRELSDETTWIFVPLDQE